MTILRNGGNGNFTEAATSPEPASAPRRARSPRPTSTATATSDLAVTSQGNNSDNVNILRNTGNGNFTEPALEPGGRRAPLRRRSSPADLDGDSDQDLAVANGQSQNVTILRNNGSGNFVEPASSPEAVGAVPQRRSWPPTSTAIPIRTSRSRTRVPTT